MLITVSPGPGTFLSITVAARHGFIAAMQSAAGMVTAAFCVVAALSAGAGWIVERNPALLPIMTIIGGLYLAWLAVGMWRKSVVGLGKGATNIRPRARALFATGFFLTITNAKFFVLLLALIPAFLRGEELTFARAATFGAIYMATSLTWHTTIAALGGAFGRFLKSPIGASLLLRSSALLFAGFGLWMIGEGILHADWQPSPTG